MLYRGNLIRITVRSNCKRMILRHRPGEEFFTMSVPDRTRKQDVERFLEANREWIEREARQAREAWKPEYAPGEKHWLMGRQVTLGADGIPAGQEFRRMRTQCLLDLLNRLLPRWTGRMGVWVAKVTVKDMERRWGSCGSNHHISINERLSMYPPECAEEVLVHELCHLHHADHSPAFYAELTAMLPGWREAKEKLDHMDVKPLEG